MTAHYWEILDITKQSLGAKDLLAGVKMLNALEYDLKKANDTLINRSGRINALEHSYKKLREQNIKDAKDLRKGIRLLEKSKAAQFMPPPQRGQMQIGIKYIESVLSNLEKGVR